MQFKQFKPSGKKQSGAVERSAAIERLERFEPAPLLDADCPRPESLLLGGFAP
jgi:hypothetical protein